MVSDYMMRRQGGVLRRALGGAPRGVPGLAMAMLLSLVLEGCASHGSSPHTTAGGEAQPQAQRGQKVQTPWVQKVIEPAEPLSDTQQRLLEQAHDASRMENWPLARSHLEHLLSQRPDHPKVQSRLAWVLQQQGELEVARSLYQQAIHRDSTDAMTVNNLALLLQHQGRFADAQALLLEGLEYAEGVPELHYNLAVVSELYLLDLETALEHYRIYHQLVGENEQRVAGWIADLERRIQ